MSVVKVLTTIGSAVVAAIVFTVIGFAVPYVIAFALVTGAVAVLAAFVMPDDPRVDAPRIPIPTDIRASEISRLAWALNTKTGAAGTRVTLRVRSILRHRLERLGVDPDDPLDSARRDELIGPDLWPRLAGSAPDLADIVSALDAIDRLSPAIPANPTEPTKETP